MLDASDARTPDKMWVAIKKGIPLRVEIGQREMEEGALTFVRRDLGKVEEGYQEVARRLGILPEAGVRDMKGPETVQ
jgi:prolyl-tRNA synthetase